MDPIGCESAYMSTHQSTHSENLHDIVMQSKTGWLRRSRILWIGVLLAMAGGIVWYFLGGKKESETVYETQPLTRDSIHLTITATGSLDPTNRVTVGSELSGTTLEVYVDSNDHVEKGQPLAKLDTNRLEQQIASSRASLHAAQSRVAQAEATLSEATAALARQEELKNLSGGKLPSRAEMETAQATVARAKADLKNAQANVAVAEAQMRIQENDLSKAIIKSPIDGIVLTRSLEPGQTVAASFTAPELFVIAEKLEHMKLKVAIAEADIGRLQAGQNASFMVDAWPGRVYPAKVSKVSYGSSITDNVVTYETELEVINEDLSLRPGMTATVDIRVMEADNVFVVPNAALRFNPTDPNQKVDAPEQKMSFVQTLTPRFPRRAGGNRKADSSGEAEKATIWILENGTPVRMEVRAGITDGRRTEISGEGLREGIQVILRERWFQQ
jgi:HlyD family secretion protein